MKNAWPALLLAGALVAAACDSDGSARDPLTPNHPRRVITTSSVTCPDTISVGQTAQCVAYFYDENNNLISTTHTWSTTTGTLVSVGSTGQITGLAVGSATVQAAASGVTGSKNVYVKAGISGSIGGPGTVRRFDANCRWYPLASGGTSPYSYSWTESGASGDWTGTYWAGEVVSAQATLTVTITDANGVTKTVSRTILTSPSAPLC